MASSKGAKIKERLKDPIFEGKDNVEVFFEKRSASSVGVYSECGRYVMILKRELFQCRYCERYFKAEHLRSHVLIDHLELGCRGFRSKTFFIPYLPENRPLIERQLAKRGLEDYDVQGFIDWMNHQESDHQTMKLQIQLIEQDLVSNWLAVARKVESMSNDAITAGLKEWRPKLLQIKKYMDIIKASPPQIHAVPTGESVVPGNQDGETESPISMGSNGSVFGGNNDPVDLLGNPSTSGSTLMAEANNPSAVNSDSVLAPLPPSPPANPALPRRGDGRSMDTFRIIERFKRLEAVEQAYMERLNAADKSRGALLEVVEALSKRPVMTDPVLVELTEKIDGMLKCVKQQAKAANMGKANVFEKSPWDEDEDGWWDEYDVDAEEIE